MRKEKYGGAYHEFSIKEKEKFVVSESTSFFSSYERAIIIYHMITDTSAAHIGTFLEITKKFDFV